MGVLKLELVDEIDAEVAVHRFIAQDVLVLLGSASHLVLATQRQNLREAYVEEQPFHQAGENDQRLQQRLIGFRGACVEVGVHDRFNEGDQELVLVTDGLDFVVSVEDLALVQAQRLHDVLVRMGMDGFFESLPQQKLTAFWGSDVAVRAQHDVVRRQRVSRHKETEIALDDAALVFGQAVGVFPQRDVTRHVHLLRHPVIGASRKVLLPCPLVLEGHELVDVCLAVDDALVGSVHSAMSGCRSGSCGSGNGSSCWLQCRCMDRQRRLRCLVAVLQATVRWFLR